MAGRDPLHRYPAKRAPQFLEDPVLERVERSEVDMAALGFEHVVTWRLPDQRPDAKAGARANDRNDAFIGQGMIGAAHMSEMLVAKRRDGMADGAKIVD